MKEVDTLSALAAASWRANRVAMRRQAATADGIPVRLPRNLRPRTRRRLLGVDRRRKSPPARPKEISLSLSALQRQLAKLTGSGPTSCKVTSSTSPAPFSPRAGVRSSLPSGNAFRSAPSCSAVKIAAHRSSGISTSILTLKSPISPLRHIPSPLIVSSSPVRRTRQPFWPGGGAVARRDRPSRCWRMRREKPSRDSERVMERVVERLEGCEEEDEGRRVKVG